MAIRRKGGEAVGISGTNYILSGLNERQQEAVTAPCQPTVVFAGPGSGKTTVLTRRILYLMEQGTPPGQIMVVTFTRAAAREMKSRLQEVNPVETDKLWIGTFHSLFLLMLQDSGMRIPPLLKDGRQKEAIRNILSQLNQPTDDDTIGTYLQQIGLCKAHAILPARMKVQKQKNILFREIYSLYEAWKREQDYWDYDDILLAMYHQVKKPEFLARWQERLIHILVDEFQDINRIQYDILVRLASRHRLLYAVGDDDQSIYGFRGSDPEIMLQLKKDFPDLKRYILTTNYRSADPIIQASERLIQKNRFRQAKVRHGLGRTVRTWNGWSRKTRMKRLNGFFPDPGRHRHGGIVPNRHPGARFGRCVGTKGHLFLYVRGVFFLPPVADPGSVFLFSSCQRPG
jgi:DNA helicase-2/ATP-dependent DNA helicase PcrA